MVFSNNNFVKGQPSCFTDVIYLYLPRHHLIVVWSSLIKKYSFVHRRRNQTAELHTARQSQSIRPNFIPSRFSFTNAAHSRSRAAHPFRVTCPALGFLNGLPKIGSTESKQFQTGDSGWSFINPSNTCSYVVTVKETIRGRLSRGHQHRLARNTGERTHSPAMQVVSIFGIGGI
jgi:hypothetical protein